jgi:2-oxo-4-hydroxy-4-carboxy-5-ureidoimidazoline decarboxylase
MDALAVFNECETDRAASTLLAWCASTRWGDLVIAGRPYASVDNLLAAASEAFDQLGPDDWQAVFAVHSRIGEPRAGDQREAVEQGGIDRSDAGQLAGLREANDAYEARFGHMFLICSAGLDFVGLLDAIRDRMSHSPEEETAVAEQEERKIVALRLEAAFAG